VEDLLDLSVEVERWRKGNSPAFGMSLPSMANTEPYATVRFACVDGVNPAGVKAVAAPANATAMSDEDNIIYRRIEKYNLKKTRNEKE